MSKYGEITAFLEYMTKMQKPTKSDRRRRKIKEPDEFDIFAILEKKKREAKILEDWIHQQEKLHKKEEKKDEKKGPSMAHIAFVLVATFPVTAPLYVAWIRTMLH